ncbi:autotransporter assembly complex protein TamA [Ottowia sp.]|uniref:autotransporter assembly complex protein TamA n=1 Tax=Ottowia sp. TaxID=1898956 RepID=UPI003A882553
MSKKPAFLGLWQRIVVLALAWSLHACALWPGSTEQAPADPADAPATRASQTTHSGQVGSTDSTPEVRAFDITVQLDDEDLKTLVERHNGLQRYQAITDLEPDELNRLMVLTEQEVRDLLATEGYFSPQVNVQRQSAPDAERPSVLITVEPGEATRITGVDIRFEGDLGSTQDAGALAQRQSIEQTWSLDKDRRFTQGRWASVKKSALRQLVETRYPRGKVASSRADIDAASHTARLGLTLDSGPPFHLGPATIQGASRYPPELAERLSWLKPGDVYEQKDLVDAQLRLAGSGYYDSAYISIDPEGDPAAVPVTYTVTEAKRQKVQLGLGYSTDSGPRVTLEHRDNQAFGTTWRGDTKLHYDLKEPLLQYELTSLPNARGWRKAALARYMRQDDDQLNTTSRTLRVGLTKAEENYDRAIYLQYDDATVTGSGTDIVTDKALLGDGAAISANYVWTGRYFRHLPTPTAGYGLNFDIGAGITTAGVHRPFARLLGRWMGLWPIGSGGSRLSMRAEAGGIIAKRDARIPGSYMFRTGGDTSVRGYGYRDIGISLGSDVIGPGRYMGVASVEYQRPIFQDRFPGLLEHTVFIDVGSVSNEVKDMRAHWGVGTGLRIISPVGPMEVDVAYGLKARKFRLHMSVGFVF